MSTEHLKISEVIRPETVDIHMDQIVNKDQAIQYLAGLLDNAGKSRKGCGLTSDQL